MVTFDLDEGINVKTARYISVIRSLLGRAMTQGDQELTKQYTWCLFLAQQDLIKELQKDAARRELEKRYRKAG